MLEPFKLSIPDLPASYQGRLYFILGPGLGDTVNDFRILHEVLLCYPHATAIVYADPRWKDLYQFLPEIERCSWRYHVAAPSGELAGKVREQSYSETFRGVIQEIQSEIEQFSGFVALGGFTCLDQLAQKELGLSTKARTIGLRLSPEHCRPFLPLSPLLIDEVKVFLHQHDLHPDQFIAVAPQTWMDKAWEPSCWQQLTNGIYEETHLPVLVFGIEGHEVWEGPGMHHALGLPLGQVAGLLSLAKCFIGLDSGLTHMAACFDVPVVGLQAQGKFPPFLVEPHSPLRRIHLTPFIYGNHTIPPESVQNVVLDVLQSPPSPLCPLCDGVPYVLGAQSTQTAYLCRCGLMYRVKMGYEKESTSFNLEDKEPTMPRTIHGLTALKKSLQRRAKNQIGDQRLSVFSYTFEHWNSRETSPDRILLDETGRELWWSWDAVDHMLASYGMEIIESQGTKGVKDDGASHTFTVKAKLVSEEDRDVILQIPWNRDLVKLKRSLYNRWLCWESFERPNELEDLGWKLVKDGFERDGRDVLRFAVKRDWRGRTLSRLLRSEWKALGAGRKKSQDIPAHA